MTKQVDSLINLTKQLDSFDQAERINALKALKKMIGGNINVSENFNLHFHSFFSYHAEKWSPSRIAWESKTKGLYASGIIDFDVLDGLQEFIEAGELLGLRTTVGIETRAFHKDFADKEIDSPGEPGISYIAGAGFAKPVEKGSANENLLLEFSKTADQRNTSLINRINLHVPEIAIDYFVDVKPLTPSGNATERHIIEAYLNKSTEVFQDRKDLVEFWMDQLTVSDLQMIELLNNRPELENKIRSKFAKKGGYGYQQPSVETFPKVSDFWKWVKSCDAIPMESWLDGTSAGESDARKLLECAKQNGAYALNLIPDRNWNIKDASEKSLKLAKINEIIELADELHMPLHIGTEMNRKGLPFVDDLSGKELSAFKKSFTKGAQIVIGHMLLSRFANFGYAGEKAKSEFPDNSLKNDFFKSVGSLPALTSSKSEKLKELNDDQAFTLLVDSAKKGKWII